MRGVTTNYYYVITIFFDRAANSIHFASFSDWRLYAPRIVGLGRNRWIKRKVFYPVTISAIKLFGLGR